MFGRACYTAARTGESIPQRVAQRMVLLITLVPEMRWLCAIGTVVALVAVGLAYCYSYGE